MSDNEEPTTEPQEDEPQEDEDDLDLDLTKKKKKAKPKREALKLDDDDEAPGAEAGDSFDVDLEKLGPWTESDRDYVYPELLKRVFDKIMQDRGSTGSFGLKKQIDPPQVDKFGTKRVAWSNFSANCKSVNRKPEHVMEYVLAEFGTTGSVTADNKLIIKGRFQSKQLENVLRKYIAEYVICRTCKSPNTELSKENRLTFKKCKDCGATSTVAAIKSGFRAQTKRKKE
eukprot:TRINITY_DN3154_c0_g1_i1.p1 TRINITY_DN3154_c0_g1~~TRINITY_DN3154_c0_g1_i1.p1  ORF type:complete len:228 (-),score=79.19 TRINITY_DN3154_c0_g1_i1:45-728(-)